MQDIMPIMINRAFRDIGGTDLTMSIEERTALRQMRDLHPGSDTYAPAGLACMHGLGPACTVVRMHSSHALVVRMHCCVAA